MSSASLKARELATCFLEKRTNATESSPSLVAQIEHRVMLVAHWGISPGSHVLEIGNGQGDCTIALADAVGPEGHVDAVDPGALDYGAPFNLGQAQSFISASRLGSRITFHHAHPIEYLKAYHGRTFDYVVLCHCIWYFETPQDLPSIVEALHAKTKHLCIAEWSLRASQVSAQPHILAALLHCTLESRRLEPGHGNIRTLLSGSQILAIAKTAKFVLEKEIMVPTNEGMLDGYWETSRSLGRREKDIAQLRADGVDERGVAAVVAVQDALAASCEALRDGVKGVKCMDTLIAVFRANIAGSY